MNTKYSAFWDWFLEHEYLLTNLSGKASFLKELDEKISDLGDFAWEVGPDGNKKVSLTISPGGNANLLPTSKEIISCAPKLSDWNFYYAKPIKEWKNYFEIDNNGVRRPIDISHWQYVLLEYEDQTFDIIVRPNPYPEEFEEEIQGVVEMVLDSIIGEENRMKKIKFIEVVIKFENDLVNNSTEITQLKNHLDRLDSNSNL